MMKENFDRRNIVNIGEGGIRSNIKENDKNSFVTPEINQNKNQLFSHVFRTPTPNKNNLTENEMRRTVKLKKKPQLIYSKLPPAFEILKPREEIKHTEMVENLGNLKNFHNLENSPNTSNNFPVKRENINLEPMKVKPSKISGNTNITENKQKYIKDYKDYLLNNNIAIVNSNSNLKDICDVQQNQQITKDGKILTKYEKKDFKENFTTIHCKLVPNSNSEKTTEKQPKISISTKIPQNYGITINSSSNNKIKLRPIEIKDPRKNLVPQHVNKSNNEANVTTLQIRPKRIIPIDKNKINQIEPGQRTNFVGGINSNMNIIVNVVGNLKRNVYDKSNLEQSPNIRVSVEKNFAKTSNVNFNFGSEIIFSKEGISNLDREEIIKIAENSKLHPAQLAFLTKHNENFSNFHKESKNDFSTDSYQLSCDEMIELYPISNLSSWGSVYKMLHVGTLKTFYIRKIPLKNRHITHEIIENINNWPNKSKGFLKIYNKFDKKSSSSHNHSNNSFYLIQENCRNGSLNDLLKSVGSLPEKILKLLTSKLLTCLEIYYINLNSSYGQLCPENIFFDEQCNPKISLGVKHLFFKYKENGVKEKFLYFDMKMKNKLKFKWMKEIEKYSQKENSYNQNSLSNSFLSSNILMKAKRQLEIFDLGLILFDCSLMNISSFEDYLLNYECSHHKEFICCCFYHCIVKYENEGNCLEKLKISKFINELRFSKEFINFLCYSMSYKYNTNISYKKLKEHNWLKGEETLGNFDKKESVFLELEDLIKISNSMKKRNEINTNKSVELNLSKLCYKISQKLPKCEDFFRNFLIDKYDRFIETFFIKDDNIKTFEELTEYFQIDKEELKEKILLQFEEFFKKSNK